MAVALQWGLETTANGGLSFSRGLIQAATTDNVQPIALIACERFGNTSAMCQETCLKIETLVLPTPQPAVIKFIRSTVGYSRNDSASHLGTSLAGIQFLGLAAALATFGPFDAATAISRMLKNTTTDKTLLPTVRQLRDLLSSLDGRLTRSNFADSIVGWHTWMLCQTQGIDADRRNILERAKSYPSTEAIEKLVDAFRQLGRIGESTVAKVTIQVTSSAPWVVAFTKWCLGALPSVFLEDGTPVLDQPGSSVTIVADTLSPIHDKFVITIHHSIGNPEELIAQASTKSWTGMVTIERCGQWMLQEYSLSREKDLHVLQVILPYAAKACLDQFIFCPSSMCVHIWATGLEGEAELRTTPFRGDHSVAKILSRMLNIETTVELKKLAEGCSVNELPLLQSYLTSPENACGCDKCVGGVMKGKCRKESFIDKIAFFICDILALSLFHCSEDLLVRIDNDRPWASGPYYDDFYDAVRSVFTRAAPLHHEEMLNCHIKYLVDWTLEILGHSAVTARDKVAGSDWAMSCFKGQAVYPTIFDTCRITRKGYLALSWVRGVLEFDGETYEMVKSHAESEESPPSIDCTIPSTSRPLNLTPDYTISWRVRATESALELGLCLDGPSLEIVHSPFNIIQNLGSCLFVERCPHDRDTELQHADPPYFYDSPLSLQVGQRSGIRVVALDGANDVRFHFLGDKRFAYDGVVVRFDACLKCCLDVCTAASRDILVF
ncbi:hypothetical protein BGZ61DRAFT_534752 [Ilyonectria robusta]|uniref:uncharacterized protein n=1 Tax=Ilyonectria robusta TaxID=1079257 RepID=UPI001E8D1E77|nr:uncharacterized protein BGZ61DRAFT_534752 [Ilyonectria robusta]KAH8684077.1 hypothetical protein BGZ61DRAFT_534752 [Ilyonectria robusta]